MADAVLTPEELAAALEVHPETVRRWIRDGNVPNVGVGRHLRVPRAWLDARLQAAFDAELYLRCTRGWSGAASEQPATAEPVLALTEDGRMLTATYRRGRWSAG